MLAAKLWSSLLPAAFGLAVGLPAYALHLLLRSRIEQAGREIEAGVRIALEGVREVIEPSPVDRRPLTPAPRPVVHEEDEFFRRKVASASR